MSTLRNKAIYTQAFDVIFLRGWGRERHSFPAFLNYIVSRGLGEIASFSMLKYSIQCQKNMKYVLQGKGSQLILSPIVFSVHFQ